MIILYSLRVGYFMLTEPHGLNYITHCEEEGFHVHPKEPPLYEVRQYGTCVVQFERRSYLGGSLLTISVAT